MWHLQTVPRDANTTTPLGDVSSPRPFLSPGPLWQAPPVPDPCASPARYRSTSQLLGVAETGVHRHHPAFEDQQVLLVVFEGKQSEESGAGFQSPEEPWKPHMHCIIII